MTSILSEYILLKLLHFLNEISELQHKSTPENFIQILPEKICTILSVPICILWKAEKQGKFKVFATSGNVDDEYKRTELDAKHPAIASIVYENKVLFLPDITNVKTLRLPDTKELLRRSWVSLLCTPLKIEKEIFGILQVFTKETRYFKNWEKELLKFFANYACQSFKAAKSFKKKKKIFDDRYKLEKLNTIMLNMTNASEVDEVLKLLLEGSLNLVDLPRGIVRRLNPKSGMLDDIQRSGVPQSIQHLKLGEGISGKALKDEKIVNAKDIQDPKWKEIYVKSWQDTRSNLAVPVFIDKVPIRIGTEVKTNGKKRIGVLNIESPEINAFSKKDEKRLWFLARCAAIRLENIESNRKLEQLREIEKEISQEKNYNRIIQTLIKGITTILGFEWVNISLVNPSRSLIKTEYIAGISKHQGERFKSEAEHSLYSNDIQANIVRSRQIEVPRVDDARFDTEIFSRYGHEHLTRAYMPMIEPLSNLVIGTIEVGYKKSILPYIYEQDIQILKNFVDDAVRAIERQKLGLVDRITHECKSPIVSIRSHASFLQRHASEINDDQLTLKLNNVLSDCDMLLYQLNHYALEVHRFLPD